MAGNTDGPKRKINPLPRVNIVVTCTKRKRVPPIEGLKLRSVEAADLQVGFAKWLARLDECCVETVSARKLYAGDHWSVVQSLEDAAYASGLNAVVWICSAGYGLVGIDANIKPYSATFSLHHPDSIFRWNRTVSHLDSKVLWWQLHGRWGGPDSSLPRSISEVAASDPESPLLVVASRDYLRAIGRDVQCAAKVLCDSDLLCIISTGTKRLLGLEANILPTGASLQKSVGGSLHSLNVRLARTILAESSVEELSASLLNTKFARRLEITPPIPRYERELMTDEKVREYISESLAEDSDASWSSLLRKLRSSGRACKQERFSYIFKSTKANLVGDE